MIIEEDKYEKINMNKKVEIIKNEKKEKNEIK